MERFLYVFVKPIVVAFTFMRWIVRTLAWVVTPVALVMSMFGYGIAWGLFHGWRVFMSPVGGATIHEQEKVAPGEWRTWGRCMTEAGYDTLAMLAFGFLVGKGLFEFDFLRVMEKLFGNAEYLIWIPFWAIALVPFLMRLKAQKLSEVEHVDALDQPLKARES
ncbi:MAG: hypothetical protein CMM07_28845 [Rhodopirellula sp.]|nr:hypothetical protein [Rhodopirellula sp.]